MWRDDATRTLYENDVVALIGNTIFLFEAKSGRLDDVARRGGELSLMRNFRQLFVEPGEQARRLENYLSAKGRLASLWSSKPTSCRLTPLAPRTSHRLRCASATGEMRFN
jgi:hypothetical protein